ncbi:hypothetical protein [Brachybacterium phenoliresistens]|uniref:Uncharacterized protein n=1 Tax=Brachybacterium phenoliresistens TaxID=396014 RepID=Z9JN40_9MICO|nr:hypothetical protein [Brachybacterium phenoliresistens]EWS79569.1 hypothetical protein BF93_13005 [Brachybacterium phenoliresistens]
MSQRALLAVVFALVGIVLLGIALWLRSGSPAPLRFWMSPFHEDWMAERLVLLGLPTAGGLLLCCAAIAAPLETPLLRLLGVALLLVLAVPMLYFLAAFLPLPAFLYPRWARQVQAGRAQAMRAFGGQRGR